MTVNSVVLAPEHLYILESIDDRCCGQVRTVSLRDHKRFEMWEPFNQRNDSFIPDWVSSNIHRFDMTHVTCNYSTAESCYFVVPYLKILDVLEWADHRHFTKELIISNVFVAQLENFSFAADDSILPGISFGCLLVDLLRIWYLRLRSS